MPFFKPFMPHTHTVPGFRLGPDLPNVTPHYPFATSMSAFTRYGYYQYCLVYGIPKGGRGGVVYCPIAVQ